MVEQQIPQASAPGWPGPCGSLAFTSEAIAEAAQLAGTKWRTSPRLNFESAVQVRLLRLLTPVIGRLTSPARKAGLKPRRRVIGPSGGEVAIRVIEPAGTPIGIVVDVHGGAWTAFRAINDDPLTVPMAQAGFVVVSVDYRLLPEHRLEHAIQDCVEALSWALSDACAFYDVHHVLLHGDSAGAHLALCAALRVRQLPTYDRLSGLVLFFGAYDLSGTPSTRAADGTTMMLHGPSLLPLFRRVAGSGDVATLRDASVSPLHADLTGLPPSLLVVGTNDPLFDDSCMLHDALRAAGVTTDLLVAPHAPHAFNRFPIRMAREANGLARRWMTERASVGRPA